MENLPQFFKDDNYFMFYFSLVALGVIVVASIGTYLHEKGEEQEEIERSNRISELLLKQLPLISTWKGKMINILSGTIAQNVTIKEVIVNQRHAKLVFDGRDEFLNIGLPFDQTGKKITAIGNVVLPNQENKTSFWQNVAKSPIGFAACMFLGPFAPLGALTWMAAQERETVQFVVIN